MFGRRSQGPVDNSVGKLVSGSKRKGFSAGTVPGNLDSNMATAGHENDAKDMDMASDSNTGFTAPLKQPLWFREVSDKLSQIDDMNKKLGSIEEMIAATQTSINFASERAQDAIDKAIACEQIALSVKQENERLRSEVSTLKARITQQESQTRRNNLLFDGLAESTKDRETWKDCEKLVIDTLVNTMGMSEGGSINFERAHRLGPKIPGKTRTVVVRFLSFKDRETVWSKRGKLKTTKIRLSEDFPPEINRERKILYPILKKAETLDTVKTAKLSMNKLYIDKKEYTCRNLCELPPSLRPENLATKRDNGVTIFASRSSFLSNLYSDAEIIIDGQTYRSTEQYLQYQKALRHKNDALASKIKHEGDPYKLMSLGRKVTGVNDANWLTEAKRLLLEANIAKFTQIEARLGAKFWTWT